MKQNFLSPMLIESSLKLSKVLIMDIRKNLKVKYLLTLYTNQVKINQAQVN